MTERRYTGNAARKRGLARFFELLVRFLTTGRLHRRPRGYLRPRL